MDVKNPEVQCHKKHWKRCREVAEGGNETKRPASVCTSSKSQLIEAYAKQTLDCATQALNFYNKTNDEGVIYELVKPLKTCPITRGRYGFSLHGNFLARPAGAFDDSSAELFFAETWATIAPKDQPEVLKCCVLRPDPRPCDEDPVPWKIYHPEDVECDWCNLPKHGEVTL